MFSDNLRHFAKASGESVDFSGVVFPSYFNFTNQKFPGHVWFNGSVFEEGATFRFSRFGNFFLQFSRIKRGIAFDGICINGNFSADQSIFFGSASFKNAKFNDTFTCTGVKFLDKVYFGSLYENQEGFRWATFKGTEFKSFATFENRFFRSQANFSHCRFHKAPEFHGCTLHQDTNFEQTEFLDTSSEHSVRAYRTLKLAMENVRARKEEADFFALEQISLRGQKSTPRTVKITSWLYEKISDYGRNFLRPFYLLVGCGLYFFTLYAGILRTAGKENDLIGTSITISMKQIVRPFWIWSELDKQIADVSANWIYAIKFFANVQSFISIVLISLFLLALRRRFKMD